MVKVKAWVAIRNKNGLFSVFLLIGPGGIQLYMFKSGKIWLLLLVLLANNPVWAEQRESLQKFKASLRQESNTEAIELRLEEIIAKSIENNLNLQIAQSNNIEAKWKYWQRISDALPDVELLATKRNRDGTFFLNTGFQTPIDETTSAASVRINYRAFNGGTTSFLAWAEKFYRDSNKNLEQAQYNKILYQSIMFYYELIKQQVALNSKDKALKNAEADYDLAKKFFDAGTGTKFDLVQAEARVARKEQELIDQYAQFRKAGIDLANHVNSPLETSYKTASKEIDKLELVDENISAGDFLKTAFEQNPDILSAVALRKAALKEGYAKAGDYLPKIDLYADFGGVGQTWDDMFGITTLGFEAKYDIGDGLGLTTVSDTMQSRAKVKRAKLEYEREIRRIERELRNSYLDFHKSKSVVKAARKELEASTEALRLAKLRYENGLDVFARLIERESELTAAELNLTASLAEYNLSQAKLAYDMGTISLESLGIKNVE